MVETGLPDGKRTKLPRIPVRLGSYEVDLRTNPPAVAEGTREVLRPLNLSDEEIQQLQKDGIITLP